MSGELDIWIRQTITPLLRAQGFHGGPRTFWRTSEPITCVIQVQGSTGNVLGRIRFTLNFGARHEGVARLLGDDDDRHKRSFSGSQIARRAQAHADKWWEIGVGADRDRAATAVRRALETEVLPFLDSVCSMPGFEAFWRNQPDEYSQRFVEALSHLADGNSGKGQSGSEREPKYLLDDQRLREWVDSDATAAAWVATCPSCNLPVLRVGAPRHEPALAVLLAAGASTISGGQVCDACSSKRQSNQANARRR